MHDDGQEGDIGQKCRRDAGRHATVRLGVWWLGKGKAVRHQPPESRRNRSRVVIWSHRVISARLQTGPKSSIRNTRSWNPVRHNLEAFLSEGGTSVGRTAVVLWLLPKARSPQPCDDASADLQPVHANSIWCLPSLDS